jgi:hypothetical protein
MLMHKAAVLSGGEIWMISTARAWAVLPDRGRLAIGSWTKLPMARLDGSPVPCSHDSAAANTLSATDIPEQLKPVTLRS